MTGAFKRSARSWRAGAVMAMATALLAAGFCPAHGVGTDDAGSPAFTPVSLTGCNGFASTITSPPERVLVTGHSEAELLYRLGVLDRVVAMAVPLQPVVLPQELIDKIEDLPSVYAKENPYGAPSAESLAAINPDFVVAGSQIFFDTQALPTQAEYEADGVGTYLMRSSSCDEHQVGTEDDFYADIENLGRVFGVQDKASALIDELKEGFGALAATLEGAEGRPTVHLLEQLNDEPDFTVLYFWGKESIVPGLIARAGGTSIFADEPGNLAETSWEVIASKAPEYIFLCAYEKDPSTSKAFFDDAREELLAFAPAATIPAVKNDRILSISCHGMVGWGLDSLRDVETMARALHPDLFG
ncbi:MAG: ABC transporter substrate-binding protein [Egibacteraceae bacterium]